MTETFDYIVVGGGSSGCVVAARLVKEKHARVLLLEAGHSHRHPLLDMPPGIFKMIKGSKFMTYHKTVPQEHLNGRAHDIPQGNVLGGGSSVNAQVYMRGRPADYDEWEELLHGDNDNPGWGWEHVLPIFRAMEANNRLHDERHGVDGPLLVSDPGHIDDFSRWFVQSVQALGEPFNHDFNGPSSARRRVLPIHQSPRQTQQRALRVSRSARERSKSDRSPACVRAANRARPGSSGRRHLPRLERLRATRRRRWRGHCRRGRARYAETLDALGSGTRRPSEDRTELNVESICRASERT